MRYGNSCWWYGLRADEVLFFRADKMLEFLLCKQRQVAPLSLLLMVQSDLHAILFDQTSISLDLRSPSHLLSDPCVCHFIEWLKYPSPNSVDNIAGSFNFYSQKELMTHVPMKQCLSLKAGAFFSESFYFLLLML